MSNNETREENLKKLNTKRGGLKTQLTLFNKYLNSLDLENINQVDINRLQQRFAKIQSLLDNFEAIQCEIDLLDVNGDKNVNEREQFQNTYFDLVVRASDILKKNRIHNESLNDALTNTKSALQVHTNVKLPRIDLPKFDGTFVLWRRFSDSFIAMIHNNSHLSNCQKLCYLRASLIGEPANMISALETTDSNYVIAWEFLCRRYNNKRKIVDNHVNAILHLNTMENESHVKLRQLIDDLENHMQCLKSLGQNVDQWDAIILPIVLQKLDSKTLHEWQTYLHDRDDGSNETLPTYGDFIKFLNKRDSILEAIETWSAHRSPDSYRAVSSDAMRRDHFLSDCHSTMCKICNEKHHILLDMKQENRNKNNENEASNSNNDQIPNIIDRIGKL